MKNGRFIWTCIGAIALLGGACSESSPTTPTATGGTSATGGTAKTGGVTVTGGQTATGGTTSTGGQTATGGVLRTGGVASTGGVSTGGISSTGGVTATGGQSATGGISATGGLTATGGNTSPGTGGVILRDAGTPDSAVGTGGVKTGGVTATGGSPPAGGGSPGNYPLGNAPVKSAGCGKTPTLTSGVQSMGSRKYIIRIPDNYDNNKPYRLIFGMHWMGGKMEDVDTGQTVTKDVWSYFGLKKLDTEKSAIFVAPNGNNCGTWCKADETFVDDMVKKFKEDLCIDESRIFSTGFSYGAIFTYSLACDRPNIFRAVAALAAAQNIGCTNGTTPVAYFAEVGMSDTLCSPALGRACRDTFVTRNGCTKPASVPEWKSADGKTHICYSYEGCKAGYPVRWCTGNFGHIAAPNDQTTGDNGNTTWAPQETWKFFTQF